MAVKHKPKNTNILIRINADIKREIEEKLSKEEKNLSQFVRDYLMAYLREN